MPLTADNDYDYYNNVLPKCPHCDADYDPAYTDDYSIYRDGEHVLNCSYCDKDFIMVSNCEWNFSTDVNLRINLEESQCQ